MESQPIRKYVYLGGARKYLEAVREGQSVHGKGFVLGNLENYLQYLETVGLPVTARGAAFVGLTKLRDELAESKSDAKLTRGQATKLGSEMQKLRVTLLSEAEGKEAFIVTSKRFDVR